jgi:serine protease inhibitor
MRKKILSKFSCLDQKSALPGKAIQIVADHPFVFILGEQESGTILFEGIYTGK